MARSRRSRSNERWNEPSGCHAVLPWEWDPSEANNSWSCSRTPGVAGGPASAEVAAGVRSVVGRPIAAVLTVPSLPVDIRHNAKIDRAAVATWAGDVLAGRRVRKLA